MVGDRYVIKRDGTRVPYDEEKIVNALTKAFKSCGYSELPEDIKVYALFLAEHSGSNTVESIHDAVQRAIMEKGYYDVAVEYIKYRDAHARLRFIKDRVDYMDNRFVNSKSSVATLSETDPNANVALKNVSTLEPEVYKPKNREFQRYRMTKKLKELFPEVANQYEIDINNHIIYPHDEASTPVLKNYCEAVSLYPLLEKGCGNMDGVTPGPPTNYHAFCGQLVNLTHSLAGQCKGAVAFGEFFNCIDYFCAKDFGPNYHKEFNEISSIRPKRTIIEAIHQGYQQIVCGWNQPAGNRGGQSPFVNISYYDENYWKALFDKFRFPDGSKPVWERISWLQKDFMEWFNNERLKALYTFPVETVALLHDGTDVIDKDWKDFTNEMWAKGHSFFVYLSDSADSLASCCRLKNKIDSNVFSFTNGLTGVMTGSCNVITLNLNRITQDYFKTVDTNYFGASGILYKDITEEDMNGFKNYLINILERVYKYHIAYKTMLYDIEKKGMLEASNAGYIKMNKLYSTIGINGHNEAAEFLGLTCNYNEDYKKFIGFITGLISEQNQLHSTPLFKFNTELVPAEGLSSKNYNWDKNDGYWVPEDRNLYNSYFYLADDKEISVLDKFRLHGKEFTSLLDGGVGLHVNLEEHLSKEQYSKLMDFAIANGTTYYTFNVPNSQCSNPDCKYIIKGPVVTCPKCGSPMDWWTRVIGFLRSIKHFDAARFIEAGKRVYTKKDEVC